MKVGEGSQHLVFSNRGTSVGLGLSGWGFMGRCWVEAQAQALLGSWLTPLFVPQVLSFTKTVLVYDPQTSSWEGMGKLGSPNFMSEFPVIQRPSPGGRQGPCRQGNQGHLLHLNVKRWFCMVRRKSTYLGSSLKAKQGPPQDLSLATLGDQGLHCWAVGTPEQSGTWSFSVNHWTCICGEQLTVWAMSPQELPQKLIYLFLIQCTY